MSITEIFDAETYYSLQLGSESRNDDLPINSSWSGKVWKLTNPDFYLENQPNQELICGRLPLVAFFYIHIITLIHAYQAASKACNYLNQEALNTHLRADSDFEREALNTYFGADSGFDIAFPSVYGKQGAIAIIAAYEANTL